MRHRKARYQFNRYTSWRTATIRSLITALFTYQSIRTTRTRAKAVRPLAEKLVSMAKSNTLADKRRAYKILGEHRLVQLLFGTIAPQFAKRKSGFTRILNLDVRRGDSAAMVILELTERKEKVVKPKARAHAKEEQEHVHEAGEHIHAQAEQQPTVKEKTAPKEKEAKKEPKAELPQEQKSNPKDAAKKPSKKFLGGIRSIFKKERDSL